VQWQELYADCVSETDIGRLETLVFDTEDAIFLRFQELVYDHHLSNEVRELKQAAAGLLEFKIKKLGWPDPMKVKPRRKHPYFRVTVSFIDKGQFAKLFVSRALAERFAARQSESPAVKSAQVMLD